MRKAIGGSSAINAHVFVPPARSLVDSWELLGNDGWNWDTLQGYYSKSYTSPPVDQSIEKALGIDGWSARNDAANGPIKASFSGNHSHPIRHAWAEAFETSRRYMTNDPFLNASVGSFSALSSINPETKERSYATSAYYNPIKGRENLGVLENAVVEKILFEDGHPPRATGVQYSYKGDRKIASASKEVIIAAGALQSPKILELSGIGNPELLEKHSIKLVKELRQVGENLHDHLVCYISYEAVDDLETLDALIRQEPEPLGKAMEEYATNKSGMLTSVGVYTYAYLSLIDILPEEGQEHLKKILREHRPCHDQSPGKMQDPDQVRAQAYYDIAEKTLLNPGVPTGAYLTALAQQVIPVKPNSTSPAGPVPGKFVSFGSMLSQPLSRGSVHIQSNDILVAPHVDPNYLSNPVDIEALAHHMQYIETIASSSSFAKILKYPLRHRDPASHLTDLAKAKEYIKTSAISMWHLGGSCAMLPQEKGGVVDSQLRVYGVEKLRVVDSSAIPLISTANLQSTVYAFAERAADLIKTSYGLA
ncbi:hypothetical protein SLS62_002390 [Diatrype stigma]|uniref:Glucose-methanol-choline oxidoreductase N-terminal domain-containing protein n=1 Tax=Diatrype stigma TaxID=117547 RepID=A0AAN9UXP0_9PEZI